jgi:CspA family cold shock protein
MEKGTVKWFKPEKGYGFIVASDDKELFVHWSKIECEGYKSLDEGESVEFERVEGPKGLTAENVKRLGF